MNKGRSNDPDHFRSLQILDELSVNDSLTQRDLSSRLGIALGLVNSYIRNLVKKGYITVKAIPPKRYAYYLTPKGFTEKTRLTYHLLQDYTRIYREARENLKRLFQKVRKEGARKVVFAGADEVAEIAWITLQETDLILSGVVDGSKVDEKFFGVNIIHPGNIDSLNYDFVVITSYVRRSNIYKELLGAGVDRNKIKAIFSK